MQRKFVSMNFIWNVGEAIDFLRKNKNDLPEDFYEIFGFKKEDDFWVFNTKNVMKEIEHIKVIKNE